MKMKLILVHKGGAGSGDFGHSGRPGKVGGSSGGNELYPAYGGKYHAGGKGPHGRRMTDVGGGKLQEEPAPGEGFGEEGGSSSAPGRTFTHGIDAKKPTRKVYGGDLYAVVGEVSRPSMGVHGGNYRLTKRGRKVVEWGLEHRDAMHAKALEMDGGNSMWGKFVSAVRSVFGFYHPLEYEGQEDYGISMAAHEMDMFDDFAEVYNRM